MNNGKENRPSKETNTGNIPSFYYGWIMLALAVVVVIATSPGQTFGIAVFNDDFRKSLGLSHTALTGAYMLGTFLAAFPLTLLGRLMDHYGLRVTVVGVLALLGLACLLTAVSQDLIMLFLAFFLLRLTGPGSLSLISSASLAFWFERRLGTVEGVRQLGFALAMGIVPATNLWLIHSVGWRGSYVVLGLFVLLVVLPLVFFVFRNRPEDVGQLMDNGKADDANNSGQRIYRPELEYTAAEARKTRSFWIIMVLSSFWAMVITALTFNIIPIFELQGLSDTDAALTLSIFAFSFACTNVGGGMLADRVPLKYLLIASTINMTVALYAMSMPQLPGMIWICGITMGLAQGLSVGITSVICVRYFGRMHLGQIRGMLTSAVIASSSVGPFLFGVVRDWTGDYGILFTALLLVSIGMGIATLFATPPGPKKEPVKQSFAQQSLSPEDSQACIQGCSSS